MSEEITIKSSQLDDIIRGLRDELEHVRLERDLWRNKFMELEARFDIVYDDSDKPVALSSHTIRKTRMSFSEIRSKLEARSHQLAVQELQKEIE